MVKYSENLGKVTPCLRRFFSAFIPFKSRYIRIYAYLYFWRVRFGSANKEIRPGDEPPGLRKDRTRRKKRNYSDGTAKFPMKELRLSGLRHVVPSPWPWNVLASA